MFRFLRCILSFKAYIYESPFDRRPVIEVFQNEVIKRRGKKSLEDSYTNPVVKFLIDSMELAVVSTTPPLKAQSNFHKTNFQKK